MSLHSLSSSSISLLGLAALLAVAPVPVSAQPAGASHMAPAADSLPAANIGALQSDVAKLKMFKLSGYVQARMQWDQSSADTVKATGALSSANKDYFLIRRARLKLTYDSGPLSQGVIYFDGGSDRAVRLLEATVTLKDPWTAHHIHALTMGQFALPFGYEIERSSSVRELPERSRAENVLFSGERDRGVKITSSWTGAWQTVAAVVNGGGINNPDFPNSDPTSAKDWLARGHYTGRVIGAGASYYGGRNVVALTGPDVVTDKTRVGVDAQASYQLPRLGGGSFLGEFYAGHDLNSDSTAVLLVGGPPTANPRLLREGANPAHVATGARGWYAMWVQALGAKAQFALRYDRWDPNIDAPHDQYRRWSVALNHFHDAHTRVTVSYDVIATERLAGGVYADPADNLLLVQLQHKF